jgi:hypothetical protein
MDRIDAITKAVSTTAITTDSASVRSAVAWSTCHLL